MIPRIRSQKYHHATKCMDQEMQHIIASTKMSFESLLPSTQPSYLPNGNFKVVAPPTIPLKKEQPQSDLDVEMRRKSPTGGGLFNSPILRINVGGRSAILTQLMMQQRMDKSRLSVFFEKNHIQKLTECDAYLEATDEYYFEKSPTVFEYIVDYYVTGRLHRPMEVCPIRLRDELEFWRIPITSLSSCCKFDDGTDESLPPIKASTEHIYLDTTCPPSEFENIRFSKVRIVLWAFLENPQSSLPAKALSIASAAFVLLSLAGLIIASLPEFQINDGLMTPVRWLQILEMCCMIFFTLEYLLRLMVNPHKCTFVRSPLNIIDLLTIVPFYVEACLPILGIYDIELRNVRGALIVVRALRLARVARIFKLARYSIGLRAFGDTMRKSAAELSMLGMFLLTGIMLFSTAIYFFERDEPNSKFYSIPSAWWWCVATMTTVGYGDLVPVTTGGKIVAAMASVCGIIVLAFPISMIIDKFAESTGVFRSRVNTDNDKNPHHGAITKNSIASLTSQTARAAVVGSLRRHRSRRYLF